MIKSKLFFVKNYSIFSILTLCGILFSCQKKNDTLFQIVDNETSGFVFENKLIENEQQNILAYEYFYNGAGVATADFNNDGLADVFMVGNQVENKLFLNKGNLKFEDITQKSNINQKPNGWKTGVSLADVNGDGFVDIYVCYSGNLPASQRKNQLLINNGLGATGGKGGIPTFTEKAEAYGLADTGYSTQAAWLDYDKDGDLDMMLINHNLRNYQRKEAAVIREEIDSNAGDKLFKNLSVEQGLKEPKFIEVSQKAGIKSNPLGFGLGLAVADINDDGYPDMMVTNDYVEDDYLYINQQNGTFKEMAKEAFGHTSRFAMGLDITDINNDLLPDIFTLDMLPEDNYRQKKLIFPDNWNTYQAELANGFWHQNMRNMLQLNTGKLTTKNGTPIFAEIGQLAGISNTDWSWAALFADFDNDGFKDLFVSNGLVKDYTDADFIKYYAEAQAKENENNRKEALLKHLKEMPTSATHSYIFRNLKQANFENKVNEWGFDSPTVASGAVYVDLDNDGDLDLITNNTSLPATIYENKQQQKDPQNWLKINLKGKIIEGTKVIVETENHQTQVVEFSPTRGFQSAMYLPLHFGIAKANKAKITINNKIYEVEKSNQQITITVEATKLKDKANEDVLFEEVQSIDFSRITEQTNDFNQQVLLPQHYSYSGSRMVFGDINGDGLTDVFLGSGPNQVSELFLGNKNKGWTPKYEKAFEEDRYAADRDAVFFDADGDKDLDLYLVSGHYGMLKNDTWQADRLYLNDGKGNFSKVKLPAEHRNSSVVKAFDIENDGDTDLVVAGHIVPGNYPLAEKSFILINNGKGNFSQKEIENLGIINDLAIVDLDKDGFKEIIAVGEWTVPIVLKNNRGNFTKTEQFKMPAINGFWNRIVADDLDNDGDTDFVLGNLGLNSQMKTIDKQAISLNFADFDKNGTIDPYLSYFIQGKAYPAIGRDEALEQVVALRKKFTSYKKWSDVGIDEVFDESDLAEGQKLEVNFLETCILENIGKEFIIKHLPLQAQYSPVHGIVVADIDNDGKKDIILAGNNSKFRLRTGKIDANYGLVMKAKDNLTYEYLSQKKSGLALKRDIKELVFVNNQLIAYPSEGKPMSYVLRKLP